MRSVLFLCGIIALAQSVTEQDFFPFGTENGDQTTPNTKGGYVGPIQLTQPVVAGTSEEQILDEVFIHNDGIISFNKSVQGDVQPRCKGKGDWGPQDVVLPYWAHVDLSQGLGGTVYYRQSQDQSLIDRAMQEATFVYPKLAKRTNPRSLLIVTWYQVPFEGASDCGHTNETVPRNTFQAVLVGDDNYSFAIFFYSNLTWTTGPSSGGNCSGLSSLNEGYPAVSGWGNAKGEGFPIFDSCSVNGLNIAVEGNSDAVPGKWIINLNGWWSDYDQKPGDEHFDGE